MKTIGNPVAVTVHLKDGSTKTGVIAKDSPASSTGSRVMTDSIVLVSEQATQLIPVRTIKYIVDSVTEEIWTTSILNIDRAGTYNPINRFGHFWTLDRISITVTRDVDDLWCAYVYGRGFITPNGYSRNAPNRGHKLLTSLVKAIEVQLIAHNIGAGWYNNI